VLVEEGGTASLTVASKSLLGDRTGMDRVGEDAAAVMCHREAGDVATGDEDKVEMLKAAGESLVLEAVTVGTQWVTTAQVLATEKVLVDATVTSACFRAAVSVTLLV